LNNKLFENGKIVVSCKNHIGGLLGETLLKYFLREDLIKKSKNDYEITEKGWEELEIIGIDIDKIRLNDKKNVNICSDSNYGIIYEHIGSYLGALIMERLFELGWFKKKDESVLEITDKGILGLESLGIRIKH
jgi:DNA-binding PadR family transcriptional regulator